MKFKDFLKESVEKHAVLAFGRMNPITNGHQKLVDTVKKLADKVGGSHHIVLSHSTDPDKNPLTGAQKLRHAKRAFPGTNFSVSTKEHHNFLKQAELLHKQGVTHLNMVGGSDRVDEFRNLLHKYNGVHKGALYNFKNIEVHSAGDRDPDAEGVSGISASKMRAFASNNDYKGFKKGVPSTMKDEHAKAMFNDVRKGMGIKEDIDLGFELLLNEGVHDKAIFKAVFLAGGPGSGKDYVMDRTLRGHGMTEINSDKALEYLMDKEHLDKTMPKHQEKRRNAIRDKAKNVAELRHRLAIEGRNGLIINGTGDDAEKISHMKGKLEAMGYDTHMLMVNTADEVSRQRNVERGQRGGRTVPEEIRKKKWDDAQASRSKFAELFKDNYVEYDNSDDLTKADDATKQAKEKELLDIHKRIKKFVATPPKSNASKEWVASELQKKDTLPLSDPNASMPHKDSKAAEKSREMGLDYYGHGRYGKEGKVTHRSVHDRLVDINKIKPTETKEEPKQQSKPKSKPKSPEPSLDKKTSDFDKIFSDIKSNQSKTKSQPKGPKSIDKIFAEHFLQEGYELSGDDAFQMLTLGTDMDEIDLNENHKNYLKDGKGNVRIFIIRGAAAKEAHIKGGKVVPYGRGYAVLLEEKQDDYHVFEKFIRSESRHDGGQETSSRSTLITESTESGRNTSGTSGGKEANQQSYAERKGTLTFKEITARKINESKNSSKENKEVMLTESIDKGIEPGLSMATSGENMVRGAIRNKPLKKPLEELTGDETTASIGDQKEDELRKKGISLTTFKKRNYV